MIPLRYPLALLGVAVALAIPLAILLARSEGAAGGAFRGSLPPGGIKAPAFALRDQRGRRVTDADLHGRAAVITFLDTRCREQCPIIATQIGRGLALLPADERRDVVALAITVDPKHDSRRAALAFLRRRRVERSLRFLIGSRAQLEPVWQAFSVMPAAGDADIHSAPVRIFDRKGVWVSTLSAGVDLTPANLAHDVHEAL